MHSPSHKQQPGDAMGDAYLAQMMRVNHAGEYGAVRIYKGQLAVLAQRKDAESQRAAALIEAMLKQEEAHLQHFEKLLPQKRIRPTILQPLWHVGGFVMGAATAALGAKAAMACTVAVERVIDEHYGEQLEKIDGHDELKTTLAQFQADEMEHHDIGLAEGAEDAPLLVQHLVEAVTRAAIRITRVL